MAPGPGSGMTASNLRAQTAALLDQALAAVDPASDAVDLLSVARQNLDGPLRVAIAGWMKAGKSTLLNALVGEPVAAHRRRRVHPGDHQLPGRDRGSVQALTGAGEVVALPFDAAGRRLVFDLGDRADDISLVLVQLALAAAPDGHVHRHTGSGIADAGAGGAHPAVRHRRTVCVSASMRWCT